MPELPAIAHVTLTVATLIAVSGGTNDSSMLHFIGTEPWPVSTCRLACRRSDSRRASRVPRSI